jgi:uncharacterized RDD family membrane protein YckC
MLSSKPYVQSPVMSPSPVSKPATANLAAPKTSPTLVGFQNKSTALPDWRIQLQNSVQQRKRVGMKAGDPKAETPFQVDGAAAHIEVIAAEKPAPGQQISDSLVVNALRRIEDSRKTYFEPTAKPARPELARPFGVVGSNSTAAAAAPAKVNIPEKPRLISLPKSPELKRDTNKLPPLPGQNAAETKPDEPKRALIERVEKLDSNPLPLEFAEIRRIRIKADPLDLGEESSPEIEYDDIEDLAPFSMRFGAGLFDLIIGAFASILVLSPVAFTSGNWFTVSGLFTAMATLAVVMFLYMTITLGFFGKTMGMRLFSLELVDAVENEYPTLRQAAVNSSIFILNLLFGGAGFLTVLFNEERRAAHDLLSGTILVREF